MRFDPGHRSDDLIDRRGAGGGGGGGGMIFALLPFLLRSKVGWLVLVVLVGVSMFGGVFRNLVGPAGTTETTAANPVAQRANDPEKEQVAFVSFVLDDAQRTWTEVFAEKGKRYQNAKLVLFTGSTGTSCGQGQSAAGPFYCPRDGRVYIDLAFYDELSRRFGAKGDFAQAYVIAHEIGHHVQTLLGTEARVRGASRSSQEGANGLAVRLELQADCYAGIWAHATARRELLEQGDVEEGLGAAAAVGDDRIQRQAGGAVHPERWTHGSSAQRARWFKTGFTRGTMESCDTFATPAP